MNKSCHPHKNTDKHATHFLLNHKFVSLSTDFEKIVSIFSPVLVISVKQDFGRTNMVGDLKNLGAAKRKLLRGLASHREVTAEERNRRPTLDVCR